MNGLNLREADKLEVTILVDNYSDLLMLQSTEVVKRPAFPPPQDPHAEHGFSCLLKIYAGSQQHIVLVDAGLGQRALFHNAELLKLDLTKVEAVVLSHGHFDHFGALAEFLSRVAHGTPLYLHPEAFLERRLNIPGVGHPTPMPQLSEAVLKDAGASIHKANKISTLASNLVLVTGEVHRLTSFEKGFPWAEANIEGKWMVDPFHDDQGVVVKVKDKGLVVIGGCSHAGIINTVKYAQAVTGTKAVYAVLGGFHLTGPLYEPVIMPTIEEMKKFNPNFVVPMHCTGWKAINQFAQEMPGQFVLNTVGTSYVFQ
jgi:7,8-dihydropterin-6-yl-methyl-4-(beta-D-ribofuranosyl)aminobenzene 5'-phosphate synthase